MPAHCTFCKDTALDRARDLFWRKGYAATSIQDLEAALGIKRSSIYNSFGGKRALYDLTLSRYQAENQQALRDRLLTADSVRAALTTLFAQSVNLEASDLPPGCYIINAGAELAAVDAEMLTFVSDNRTAFIDILTEVLARAQVQGELKADADIRHWATYLFVWYNGLKVVSQTAMPTEELATSVRTGLSALPWA